MKRKTVKLSDSHRLNDDGTVDFYGYDFTDDDNEPHYNWQRTKYRIGAEVILMSQCNMSPNAIRQGNSIDIFYLVFDRPDGIEGNSNPNIKCFHGWRGTYQDMAYYAHGLRKIIAIRELDRGGLAVTVGTDLLPEVR